MTFKTNTTLFISRAELAASAKHQDTFYDMAASLARAFGNKNAIEKPSAWRMVKIALGRSEVSHYGPATITLSRKGIMVDVAVDDSLPEEVTIEYFSACTDIIRVYAPVAVSTVTGMMAATAIADRRVNTATKKISKAMRNR